MSTGQDVGLAGDGALLQVDALRVRYGPQPVVDGVGFALVAGETLGIVGESGSGKSQTALAVLGLSGGAAQVEGSIRFEGRELLGLRERDRRRLRGSAISAVFQNPGASLNPHLRLGEQLSGY